MSILISWAGQAGIPVSQPKLTMDIMIMPAGSKISGLDELLELVELYPRLMMGIILDTEATVD